jgi:RNA polymerase sigma-70 factor (ECF subfamily)
MQDELRLVKRLRNGENGAMREFYTLYADELASVCRRYIENEETLKDVFQDVLIRIFTQISEFNYQGIGSLRAWASRLAVNQSLNYLRKVRREELVRLENDVIEEEAEDPPIEDIPPEVIKKMVNQLPIGCRTVFNLYVFEDKNHQEIAELLGIKVNSSSSQLSRAKNLLAKMIKAYNEQ